MLRFLGSCHLCLQPLPLFFAMARFNMLLHSKSMASIVAVAPELLTHLHDAATLSIICACKGWSSHAKYSTLASVLTVEPKSAPCFACITLLCVEVSEARMHQVTWLSPSADLAYLHAPHHSQNKHPLQNVTQGLTNKQARWHESESYGCILFWHNLRASCQSES